MDSFVAWMAEKRTKRIGKYHLSLYIHFGGTFSILCRLVEIFFSNNVSYKALQVSPEGLVFTSKARAINELAEIGGRQHEIAALIDMFKLVDGMMFYWFRDLVLFFPFIPTIFSEWRAGLGRVCLLAGLVKL